MKIQLKRSNVLEGSPAAAKEPTADQMEYGELAVNYNTDDPAIFIKASDNSIVRIAGVGNIADGGQVEVPSNIAPPSNPEPGNLWYNSEDGQLYVYYDDGNSSQWVVASPSNGGDSSNTVAYVKATPPSIKDVGELWFSLNTAEMFVSARDTNGGFVWAQHA